VPAMQDVPPTQTGGSATAPTSGASPNNGQRAEGDTGPSAEVGRAQQGGAEATAAEDGRAMPADPVARCIRRLSLARLCI